MKIEYPLKADNFNNQPIIFASKELKEYLAIIKN
jgi:hypothetical protein